MKSLCVKIASLCVIGAMHSASMCMLLPKAHKYEKKVTKKAMKAINSVIKADQGNDVLLALPAQRPPMEPNFFTELPKEMRAMCVPSAKPNRHVEYKTRHLYRCQQHCWMLSQIQVSSTSRLSREVFLRDYPDLANYIRCSNGVRLYPNPTSAIKIAHERGLTDKSGLRTWHNDQTEYERSHEDSILSYQLMEKVRYNQENPPLVKCSIQ